ncbi:MAG: DNA replication and repair protein RecF [Deltaproteobacteria bacterium]|nr:DNA replication and repair protein RecF [Deltaproteobacteria bacterium]
MTSILRVTGFAVQGFRNLGTVILSPHERVNLFVGANGQGKTSLLEAVDFVATLRSFRGATRSQLIGHGVPQASARMVVEGGESEHEFRVSLDRRARECTMDGKRPERAVQYYGSASCVVFHPQDLDLIRGAPDIRRRLLDRILVRVVDGYGEALRNYVRTLKARNSVLRSASPDLRAIAAYDPLLSRFGSAIARTRNALTNELLPAAREAAQDITLATADLSIAYKTKVPFDADEYRELLARCFDQDRARMTTTVGPHADDVSIKWGGRVARDVVSQGQTRALALALRLAELEVLRARSGRVPWLLLDDISSELDRERTERLFARISSLRAQIWVTTTDPTVRSLLPEGHQYLVESGGVKATAFEG